MHCTGILPCRQLRNCLDLVTELSWPMNKEILAARLLRRVLLVDPIGREQDQQSTHE